MLLRIVYLWALLFLGTQAFGQTDPANPLTLSDLASFFKGAGELNVTLQSPIVKPTGVDDLSVVARQYSVVLATPTASVTVPTNIQLGTWVKFQKAETILLQDIVDRTDQSSSVPKILLPIKNEEFVLFLSGGSLVVDGVTFTQKSLKSLNFRLGQRYLLFLYLESDSKLARLAALDNGVFLVDAEESLTPFSNNNSAILREVKADYGSDLHSLRPALKNLKADTK